jgi:hypothetical protein
MPRVRCTKRFLLHLHPIVSPPAHHLHGTCTLRKHLQLIPAEKKVLGIRAQVLKDIGQAEITQDWGGIIKKYGTHYVSEVYVGGLMQSKFTTETSCAAICAKKADRKPTASMSDTIKYLVGVTAPLDFEDNFVAPRAEIYSAGGDPDLGVGCQLLTGCTPYNLRAWSSAVFAQSVPYAVVLTPISMLFSNGIGRMNRCLSIDTALGT